MSHAEVQISVISIKVTLFVCTISAKVVDIADRCLTKREYCANLSCRVILKHVFKIHQVENRRQSTNGG